MNKHPLLYNLAVRPPGYSHIFCLEDKHTDGTKALKYQTAQEINEEKTNWPEGTEFHRSILGLDENNCLLGSFVMDFDGANPEKAQEDCRTAMTLLLRVVPAWALRVWFSGRRGFHLSVHHEALGIYTADDDLNLLYRFVANEIAQSHLTTADLGIYDRMHHLRMPGSWHQSGKRYKTRLTYSQLYNLPFGDILDLATQPDYIPEGLPSMLPITADEHQRADEFMALARLKMAREEATRAVTYDPTTIRRLPDGSVPGCILALMGQDVARDCGRNRSLWVLLSYWRSQGVSGEALMERAMEWNNVLSDHALTQQEVSSVLRSVETSTYTVGCRTPELNALCPGRAGCCYFTKAAAPTEEMKEIGWSVTETSGGFSAVTGEWSFNVSNIQPSNGTVAARVKINGPNGIVVLGDQVNFNMAKAKDALLRGVKSPDRDVLRTHLVYLTEYIDQFQRKAAPGTVMTKDDSDRTITEEDGRYFATTMGRDGCTTKAPITDFLIEVVRVYFEPELDNSLTCIRELRLTSMAGGSARCAAYPIDVGSKQKFIDWCHKLGNYNYMGNDNQLQPLIKRTVTGVAVEDAAICLNHIGHIDLVDGLFCWGNAAVYNGKLLLPDSRGYFRVAGQSYQPKANTQDSKMPNVCLQYVDSPERMDELKVKMFTLIKENLLDYRGWIALGLVYAGIYLPEIERHYRRFPGLEVTGTMGSGKNTLLCWLLGACGLPVPESVYSVDSSTPASMHRTMAYYSGFPFVLDEWRNTKKMSERCGLFRAWYDRTGRSISDMYNRGKTVSYKVRGWSILAGQDRTSDTAMHSRYIPLLMSNRHRSSDQRQKQQIDVMMEQEASAICLDLLINKTPEVSAQVVEEISLTHSDLMRHVSGQGHDRISFNYAVAITGLYHAWGYLCPQEEWNSFMAWVIAQMQTMASIMQQETESVSFVNDLPVLISRELVHPGEHYMILQNLTCPDGRYIERGMLLWFDGVYDSWHGWRGQVRREDGIFSSHAVRSAIEHESWYHGSCECPINGDTTQRIRHPYMVLDLTSLPSSVSAALGGV